MPSMDVLDVWWVAYVPILLLSLYYFTQGLYSLSLLVDGYLFSRPVNMIDMSEKIHLVEGSKKDYPTIVLFYPVLEELEFGHADHDDCVGGAGISKRSLSCYCDPELR